MKLFSQKLVIAFIALSIFAVSCKKAEPYPTILPPAQANFLDKQSATYSVLTANSSFKVGVGVTQPANTDRKITINVSSPTGAVAGTHYTITNPVLTMPAGKVIDSVEIKGILGAYTSGRVDTLILTISLPEITPSTYNSTIRVVLRGPCFEGNVNLSAFRGNYKAIETFGAGAPYGPYNTTISAITNTSPTTGTVTVTNIFDAGWGPIQFVLDWTNPLMRTATVVAQAAIPGSNAGDLNPAYNGQTIAVRAFPAVTADNTGTFSACNSTLSLKMQLGVTGVGFFAPIYTVNLSR